MKDNGPFLNSFWSWMLCVCGCFDFLNQEWFRSNKRAGYTNSYQGFAVTQSEKDICLSGRFICCNELSSFIVFTISFFLFFSFFADYIFTAGAEFLKLFFFCGCLRKLKFHAMHLLWFEKDWDEFIAKMLAVVEVVKEDLEFI